MATQIQNKVLDILLSGGCVSNGYRILDSNCNPVKRIQKRTFNRIKSLLRKKGIVYVINKSKVRQEHGNAMVKRNYKKKSK